MSPSAKDTTEPEGLRPKYVPLRKDQYAELTAMARDLQDARSRKTERITENTLIRVAVDIITSHPELLVGDTEEEIRSGALKRLRTWSAAEGALERLRALATTEAEQTDDPGQTTR